MRAVALAKPFLIISRLNAGCRAASDILKDRRVGKSRYLLDASGLSFVISSSGVAKVAGDEKHTTHAGCGGSSAVS